MARMMMIFSLVIALFGGRAEAGARIFEFSSGKKISFNAEFDGRAWVSRDCASRPCEALARVRQATSKRGRGGSRLSAEGGAHPGALFCEDRLGGEVVVGIDPDLNERSFCQFKDGSMIDNTGIVLLLDSDPQGNEIGVDRKDGS